MSPRSQNEALIFRIIVHLTQYMFIIKSNPNGQIQTELVALFHGESEKRFQHQYESRQLMFNNLQTNGNSAFSFLQRFRRNADTCRLQTCMIENHQSIGNIVQKIDFQNAFNPINCDNSR